MNRRQPSIFGAILFLGAAGSLPASAQTTFQSYRCADGSQFMVGFFQYDKRAHLQINGKAVTLAKRLSLSGRRYSGSRLTLKITKTATTLKHGRRSPTSCELT